MGYIIYLIGYEEFKINNVFKGFERVSGQNLISIILLRNKIYWANIICI